MKQVYMVFNHDQPLRVAYTKRRDAVAARNWMRDQQVADHPGCHKGLVRSSWKVVPVELK